MPDVQFPKGFLWGSATSAHQVEGGNANNDWWAWEQAGRVKTPSGAACDQYHRFRDDFDLAKSIGHNAHRFSIEWSRVEPREGIFDDTALAHYRDVVVALRTRGLEPLVTLHHFTNPLWLAKDGGWANPNVVARFARYAQTVAKYLGDQVRHWLTINEPMVYVTMHYADGTGPPGLRDVRTAFRVLEHLIRAHAVAYHILHKTARDFRREAVVTLASHAQPFSPCHPRWIADRWIARLTEQLYNHRVLQALTDGRMRIPGKRMFTIPEAKQTLDVIGLNYYGRIFMRFGYGGASWWGLRCNSRHHPEVSERNALEWDVYPPGIRDIIRWARPYQRPILITENGICTTDDAQRERFIVRHLQWVGKAIQEGLPVVGYLYWSLLDNFEWAEGYGPRFGLIEVDYATQQRRIRPSAHRFAEICRTNRVPSDAVEI